MPKKTKQIIPTGKSLDTDKDYQNLLDELKSIIAKGQYQAYKAVDNIKVQTHWQLGERCYVSVPATSLATRSLSWRLPLFPMFGVPFRARPYRSVERNT